MTSPQWTIDEVVADAATVHARPMPVDGRRRLTVVRPTAEAVVIGSAQPADVVAGDVPMARRRGGGGAVWISPDVAWIELFVPTGDPLWDPDVGRAFHFAGRMVAEALGLSGADVHRGPLQSGRWGRLVCFAAVGPGEVTVAGRKLVGWTQRRTRAGSRFSGLVYPRWDPAPLVAALALDDGARRRALDDLATAGIGSIELGLGGRDAVVAAVRGAATGS